MERRFISLGALLAGIGVALGAFGTHGLRDKVSQRLLETWQTGVQYHVIHAIGLIVVGILCAHSKVRLSGWLMVSGIVIFAGTLYAYVLTEIKAFAIVTPLGGLCFILAWLLIGIAFWKDSGD